MRVLRMLGVLLVVLVFAAPATAGTVENPDLVDPCGGTVGDDGEQVHAIHEAIDLCRGWIETLSEKDATPELRFTLETAASAEDRLPSLISMMWQAGDCAFRLEIDDSTNDDGNGLQVACGDEPAPVCPVPGYNVACEDNGYWRFFELPAGAIVVDGNRVQFTVRFDGALAEFAPLHGHGSQLTDVDSLSAGVVGPVYGWSFGCSTGLGEYDRCSEINGDWMHAVAETYTVGA